jgi:hypothetical protein
MDTGIQVEPLVPLSTEINFWGRAARISRLLKVTNEVIREKNGGNTKKFWKKWKNNMFKWYGHVVRIEENGWPKRIMTCHVEEDPK